MQSIIGNIPQIDLTLESSDSDSEIFYSFNNSDTVDTKESKNNISEQPQEDDDASHAENNNSFYDNDDEDDAEISFTSNTDKEN